jgi:hypothetical protein
MTHKPTDPGHHERGARSEERRAPASQRDGAAARADVARYMSRHRLEDLHRVLQLIAMAVFGAEATVVPHLRGVGVERRLTFVVDAADPSATVRYVDFLPRERAFWAAYAAVEKPNVPFAVAIRPARGWSRTEALAPLFTALPFPEGIA